MQLQESHSTRVPAVQEGFVQPFIHITPVSPLIKTFIIVRECICKTKRTMDDCSFSLCDLPASYLRLLVNRLPAHLKLRLRQTCKYLMHLVDATGVQLVLRQPYEKQQLKCIFALCGPHLSGLDASQVKQDQHTNDLNFCSHSCNQHTIDLGQQIAATNCLPALVRYDMASFRQHLHPTSHF